MERSIGRSGKLASRSRGLIAGAVATLTVLAILARLCCFTVDSGEYAIVTDFGKPTQVITAPGLGLKLPYQSVRTFDHRLFVFTAPSSEFLTLEKTPVVAAGSVVWRVNDPRKFFETVFDAKGAESRLGDILFSELGATVGRQPLTAFVSIDPDAFRADMILADMVRRCREIAMNDYGIEIVDVQLRSFDYPKQNRPRLYARMKSERGRMSMQYRSEGEEEGLKVRAAAEEAKAVILAKATEVAQARRGEGDGEAARIYAAALNQAPEFYAFLRAIEASRSFLGKGTTMVLPADSPLFGVLFDSNYFNGVASWPASGSHPEAPKR